MSTNLKRWLVIMEDGEQITISKGPIGPQEKIVEGAAMMLASKGKAGYLVSLDGPLSSDEASQAVEERSFGEPTVPFAEVLARFKKRQAGQRKFGWRF